MKQMTVDSDDMSLTCGLFLSCKKQKRIVTASVQTRPNNKLHKLLRIHILIGGIKHGKEKSYGSQNTR